MFATQIPGVEVDDAAAIVLIFSGGRTAQITTSFNSWHSHFIEIIGTRGLLRIDDIAWNNEDQAVVLKQQTEEGVAYFEFNPKGTITLLVTNRALQQDASRCFQTREKRFRRIFP